MKRTVPAIAALVAATAVWGSTFIVTKDSLDELDPASFLTWRFGIGAVVLLLVRPRAVTLLNRADQRRSAALGVALAAGFLLQTTGLQHTLAGVSGFLTGAAVILTPVVAAVFFKEQVGAAGWAAVALSAVGIGVLAGGLTAGSPVGAALTLAGAACFAVHITGLSQWATRENALGMTTVSVVVAAVICGVVAAAGVDGITVPTSATAWRAAAYLGIVATCIGFAVQAWAQAALTATTAAVVMTMEPFFAAVLAVALGESGLGWLGWAGGLLIVGGMTLAELGPRECCDAMAPRVECC
ncbi:DMT family transporter [Intrasporangium sp.]|uniref:DMT family transporter n=1 Tax=Intrasporangium sp. TaxID=1925024 RepID=UPI003365A0CE